MAGGLLQLTAVGSQDQYITGNPQITFFKIVYRRYTNFAMETIRQEFKGSTGISLNTETILKTKIERSGDLVKDIHFVIKIPDIYSKNEPFDIFRPNVFDETYEFQWIKFLGNTIIDNFSLTIGGSIIDKQYGEWLTLWNELTLSESKKNIYYELIGNTEELYDPAKYNNKYGGDELILNNLPNLGPYTWNVPPNFVPGGPIKLENVDGNIEYVNENSNWFYLPNYFPQGDNEPRKIADLLWWYPQVKTKFNYPSSEPNKGNIPSISGRNIYVPLSFWFSKNSGLALPLIAIQYHEIEIQINLRKVFDWYTVKSAVTNIPQIGNPPTADQLARYTNPIIKKNNPAFLDNLENNSQTNNFPWFFIRTRPNGYVTSKTFNISQYIDNSQLITSTVNDESLWESDPHLLINYIFLDEDERRKFSLNTHEYLIEQIQKQSNTGLVENITLELNFQHPIKELVWAFQRDDSLNGNQHTNFTNWKNINVSPWNLRWYNDEWGNYINGFNYVYTKITNNNIESYKKNIMLTAGLLFNGEERFSERDNIFFNSVQPFNYHESSKEGIYNYSFSLDPENYQPSGTCNFSRINKVHFRLALRKPSDTITSKVSPLKIYDYRYNLSIYAINYNILKVMSGMASLGFSN